MRSNDILKILILLITVAVFEGTLLDVSGLFSTCLVDTPVHSTTFTFTIAIYSLLACVALFVLIARNDDITSTTTSAAMKSNNNNSNNNGNSYSNLWRTLGLIGLYVVWWMATFATVHAVEMTLNDRRCSRHGDLNAVSNHFAFFVFHSLQLSWFIGYCSKRTFENYFEPRLYSEHFASGSVLRRALVAIYAVFIASSLWTLSHTWLGGYHSLRQCLLGALIAVISHFLCKFERIFLIE